VVNIPALMATDASSLYARNLLNFITPMLDAEHGGLNIDRDDEVIESSLLCKAGEFLKPKLLNQGAGS
jgi:NAD(P) transhydrogenase subunit alpha